MDIWQWMRWFAEAVISILAIVNPVGGLPSFVGLTQDMPVRRRRRLLRLAGMVAFIITITMAVAGKFLLNVVFRVTINEFMFGGGILLIVVGIRRMIIEPPDRHAAQPSEDGELESGEVSLAVTPIATPLLVGPGTIITCMLIVDRHGMVFALSAIAVAFTLIILLLNYTHLAYRIMGPVGSMAVGRVMQIFIIAIGAHFVFQSLTGQFALLAPPPAQ